MRFVQEAATGWAATVAAASSSMEAKNTVRLALDTSDDIWFLKDNIAVDDKLVFGDSPNEEGADVKTLLVKETEFDAATSTLHVTGTLKQSATNSSRTKKDLLNDAPDPTRRISIAPASVITLRRDSGFSLSIRQKIIATAQPDRRSEALAVVILEKDFSSANVRILAGEEQRLNETVKVDASLLTEGDGNSDLSAASKKNVKNERKLQHDNKKKESKQARSTKGQLSPLQDTLFESAIDALLANLDLEHDEPCPLLVASLGEAAHNFQAFARTHAASKHNKPLLQMANDAIVVDTYGAAGQGAAKADSTPDAKDAKSNGKKGKKAAGKKSTKESSPSSETSESSTKNKDNLWLPAYRQNISKKNMGPFDEMLMRPDVLAKIHNVRFDRDLSLVLDVQERVRREASRDEQSGRVAYGVRSVEKAAQEGAIGAGGIILVNKSLFHEGKFQEAVAVLSNKAREDGGEVRILSDTHECGQNLAKLAGIAAILTFPVFGLDDLDEEGKNGEKK